MSELQPSGQIEDARDFAASLEVAAACEERPAGLDYLAPLLALFARSGFRQSTEQGSNVTINTSRQINKSILDMHRHIQ